MKRPVQPPREDKPGDAGPDDGQFMLACPTVYEMMTEVRWDDGKARQTSTMLIFAHEGRWKASFKDREHDQSAWVSADTLNELWAILEAKLCDGSIEWRKERPFQGRKKS